MRKFVYGGKSWCKTLLAMLGLVVLVGPMMSEEPREIRTMGVSFNYEDSTTGSGKFAIYNKITAQGPHADALVHSRLANVYLQKTNHGSGSIEKDSLVTSKEYDMYQVDPDMIYGYGLVAALDNYSMVYSPLTMSVGRGYYAATPVNFTSLLSDSTQIKNYASKTSMGHETNYAHAINMDLVASAEDDYLDTGVSQSLGRTLMNLDGGVTEGTARIRMLRGDIGFKDWSAREVDIDQVYTGTFNFATKMDLTLPIYKAAIEDDWMPCCFGGYLDMPTSYRKGPTGFGSNVTGIFDCTYPKNSEKKLTGEV